MMISIGKLKKFGEKYAPVPIRPSRISHKVNRYRTGSGEKPASKRLSYGTALCVK
jgi:hypothetical protein